MDVGLYLSFHGNCREAFERYCEILGGEIVMISTYGESPMAEHVPKERHEEIIHAQLKVGDRILMASDMGDEDYQKSAGIQVYIGFTAVEEAERVFNALAEGGTVVHQFGPTFWAAGFGLVNDRFGIPWLINCDHPEG
ncbi:MAG: VOC family protein [Paracoccaceae bacterium]|nr:VOC family protein [Paracoccaceae bacterium]MDE2911640.1 VOC family protein [Paracoccaceae bacterium]